MLLKHSVGTARISLCCCNAIDGLCVALHSLVRCIAYNLIERTMRGREYSNPSKVAGLFPVARHKILVPRLPNRPDLRLC